MLNPSALRFLAFLPDRDANAGRTSDVSAGTATDLSEAIARHDPDLRPVDGFCGGLLWTAERPVEVPVIVSLDGMSCSVGWVFEDARPGSTIGRWGGFVTIVRRGDGERSASRSSDGLMTASVVRTRHGIIVSSQTPAWLLAAVDVPADIDWTVIAAMLGDPTITGHRSAIRCVTMVPPGCRVETVRGGTHLSDGRPEDDLRTVTEWDPCAIAHDARPMSTETAESLLREAVDHAVGAWAGVSGHVLLELSGGLDSSILAGTLIGLDPGLRMTFVNASTAQAGGDERHYARDVARLCRRPLAEIMADRRVLDIPALRDLAQPSEPILYGLDVGHDAQMSAHAAAVRATSVFTGQGGDAVFFQMPDLAIAVDAFRLWGWRAIWSENTRDAAHRVQRSVWSAWSAIAADWIGRPRRSERFPARMTTPETVERATVAVHPWLQGAEDLPPAKARHLEAIAHSQIFYGPTQRALSTLFVHPLLSRPVVEACLSIPVPILTGGRFDRRRARAAFAGRLPASVADRNSKGEAASHYSLAVARMIADLRSLLLDGRLVAEGLLDPVALEQALRAETLLWSDVSRPLMLYGSIEAWIRYWERV